MKAPKKQLAGETRERFCYSKASFVAKSLVEAPKQNNPFRVAKEQQQQQLAKAGVFSREGSRRSSGQGVQRQANGGKA